MTAARHQTRRVALIATQGLHHADAERARALLEGFAVEPLAFERSARGGSALILARRLWATDAEVVVIEGTGSVACMVTALVCRLRGLPFVVSSGDAVSAFLSSRSRLLWLPAIVYESALYRSAAGFIGWTPYLAGRALTLGCARAVTAPGWTELAPRRSRDRAGDVRAELGIGADAVVFGIAGSIVWNRRHRYAYGLELIRAIQRVERDDLAVLIVGDGSGLDELADVAGSEIDKRVFLTGRVPRGEVPRYLAAMDVASLPQSLDNVGSFRYSTKLPEYLAAELPVVTGQLPVAYDLGGDWLWRLPGRAPWSDAYVTALAALMGSIDRAEIERRRVRMPGSLPEFDRVAQQHRVADFIEDLCADA